MSTGGESGNLCVHCWPAVVTPSSSRCPQGQLMPLPDGVELPHAAALPEVACTVWSNLVMTAGLQAGQVVLFHGGASGIGTHGIQVAAGP